MFFSHIRNRYNRFQSGGNESLDSIDLSWNNIRGRSAIDVANGIKVLIFQSLVGTMRILGKCSFKTMSFENERIWTGWRTSASRLY